METINIEDNLYQLLKMENLSDEYKHFKFHHMGVATNNIERSFEDYQEISYQKGDYYIDGNMGLKGLFAINAEKPTLEILENLPGYHSLDVYLKNFIFQVSKYFLYLEIKPLKPAVDGRFII